MDNAPIVMIPIERLYSHPDNPPKGLGDLTELTESVKANGVMQNLTVVPAHQVKAVWDWLTDPRNDIPGYAYSYVVLIGHRRMAAAKEAGLKELPCAVIEASDPKEQISIMRLNITSGVVRRAQKVVIYGPEGIGKSTLASKFPNPLFIDTENGTQHMDVRRVDAPANWVMLMETVRAVRDNPSVCGTLVLDTADWAEMLCVRHVCAQYQVNGIEDFGWGKGYKYVTDEFGKLLNLLSEVVDRGIHVVITAHSATRRFDQPDQMASYDRYALKLIDTERCSDSALLKEWADMVLFCNFETFAVALQTDKKGKPTKVKGQAGKRVMFTSHHVCWDAKNRVGLPEKLPLDYAPLAQYFDAGITATQAAAPQPESPAQKVAERDILFK